MDSILNEVTLKIANLLQPLLTQGYYHEGIDLAMRGAVYLCKLRRLSGRTAEEIFEILERHPTRTLEDLLRFYQVWDCFPGEKEEVSA